MLIANLKNLLNTIKKNPFTFFFSFLLMPLALALILFKSQSSMMSGEIDISPISINIVDNDMSSYSELIKKSFETEESKKYFILSEDNDYLISIPKGFENKIVDNNKIDLSIETISDSPSIYDTELINSYLNSLGQAILKNKDRSTILSSIDDEEKRLQVLNDLNYIDSPIEIEKENILKEEKIPFNEYNGIVMIQYIFISFLLSSIIGSKKLSDTTGLPMRMKTLPVNRYNFELTEIITNTLTLFAFSSLYIFICRIIDMGFSNNLGLNLLIALSISLTTSTFLQFLSNIKQEIAIVVVYVILYGQLILGGMMGPVNKLFENTVIENFMDLNLNSIFTRPFMDLGNGIFNINSLIPGITVSLLSFVFLCIAINLDKFKKRR